MFQFKLNKNKTTIIYKLLNDLVFLILFFFILTLIAEGMLPGLVSSHISFLRIIFFLVLNIFAIYIIGNFLKLEISKREINKKIAVPSAILATILILNSLLKINLFLAFIILVLLVISSYLIYTGMVKN
jgi:hypothetical protein